MCIRDRPILALAQSSATLHPISININDNSNNGNGDNGDGDGLYLHMCH